MLCNYTLQPYFKSITLTPFSDIHKHNARHKHHLVMLKVKHEFAKESIRYDIPKLFNKGPSLIMDKVETRHIGRRALLFM